MMNKRPKWDAFLFLAKLLNKTPWPDGDECFFIIGIDKM